MLRVKAKAELHQKLHLWSRQSKRPKQRSKEQLLHHHSHQEQRLHQKQRVHHQQRLHHQQRRGQQQMMRRIMLVHMLWLVFCDVYTSLVCFKSHITWFRCSRRWVHTSHGQWWEGQHHQEGPQGACTSIARCRGNCSVSMHVSLMCCNLMCAYPMQCVSNTRQRSKQIGPILGPRIWTQQNAFQEWEDCTIEI